MSGMSVTDKRRQVIDFSVPYSNSGRTFATLKDSPLAKLPDTGMRFSLTKDEAGAVKVREYKTTEEHDLDLASRHSNRLSHR